MAIEGQDWLYLGGAALGGLVVGAVGHHVLSAVEEPIFTGLTRAYKAPKGMPDLQASVWALPGEGYVSKFEEPYRKGPSTEAFPDLERPVLPWSFSAALFADDVMARLDYRPKGPWGEFVQGVSEIRAKERPEALPAIGRRSETRRRAR